MGRVLRYAAIIVVLQLLAVTIAAADSEDKGRQVEGWQVVTAGNGIYDVAVENTVRIGTYTARTGATHPVTISTGAVQPLLYGGASLSPGTGYTTIRSYTTMTEYHNGGTPTASPGFVTQQLDASAVAITALGTTGYRTTWITAGPDQLQIQQDVRVNGTTFYDSRVEITTTVQNIGPNPVDIGIRYLHDALTDGDDGPSFTQFGPDGLPQVTEQGYGNPWFVGYRLEDNDPALSPEYAVYGTVSGPATMIPSPTPPNSLMFTSWGNAVGNAFDYTPNPALDVASGWGDSAVLYYFGPNVYSAMHLFPGNITYVSVSLAATQAGQPQPTFCDCLLEDGFLTGTALCIADGSWMFTWPGDSRSGMAYMLAPWSPVGRMAMMGRGTGFIVFGVGTCPSGPGTALAVNWGVIPFQFLQLHDVTP